MGYVYDGYPIVATEANGVWSAANELSFFGEYSDLGGVSCPSAGSCTAAGYNQTTSSSPLEPVVVAIQVVARTVPGAPTAVTPTAGKGSVKLTWKAPSSTGGSAITGYVIKPSIGAAVTVGKVTSYTITKLTNGTVYTFTVAAKNSVGTGTASARSKSVIPDGLYIATKTLPKATKGANTRRSP